MEDYFVASTHKTCYSYRHTSGMCVYVHVKLAPNPTTCSRRLSIGMKKKCPSCLQDKEEECFNKNKSRKDGLAIKCKECRKQDRKHTYKEDSRKLVVWQRAKRLRSSEWLSQFKKKCSFCPEDHPACLDFHHNDPKTKVRSIAHLLNFVNIDNEDHKNQVIEEIKKCTVICSNCHRKLHWKERQELAAGSGLAPDFPD